MPPKKEKEAFVVLLDVGNNTAICDDSGETFLDKAKKCLSKIVQRKLFSSAADEFGLILFGSKKTVNKLASEDEDRYQNIEIVTNLSLPSWDLLKYVHNLTSTPHASDWVDVIIVAIQYILEQIETKDFVQKRLVILSNFSQDICDEDIDENIDVIVNKMKSMNLGIVVIGPDVISDTDTSSTDKPHSQVFGVTLISQIVTQLDGTICTFEDAFQELMYFQRKSVRPSPWNAEFIISEKIKIPITGYKKTAELTPIKWFNESIDNKDAPIDSEKSYVRYDSTKGSQITVNKDDVIGGYLFGETIVPYSNADKETMTYKSGNKGLYLIYCTPKKNVAQYMLLGTGCYVITNRRADQDSASALEAFILALHKVQKVAIVRKVYSTNSAVVVGALFPIVTEQHRYFILGELPFKEDENIYQFPSLKKVPPRTAEQSKAVSDLIDSMNLDETDNTSEIYDPRKTYDPYEQYTYHCIAYKALHPNEPLPDNLRDIVKPMLQPLPEIVESAKHAARRIEELFPLKIVEKKRKVNPKNEQDVVENDDGYETQIIEKVGTENPEEDFLQMLKQGTNHTEACQSMQETVVGLLSLFSDEIEKPLGALKTLRKSCVCENPNIYNSWMFDFKNFLSRNHITTVWDAIIDSKLGLITQKESKKSDVSVNNAEEFLNGVKADSNTSDIILEESFDSTKALWDEL